jgi:hypothetical protein
LSSGATPASVATWASATPDRADGASARARMYELSHRTRSSAGHRFQCMRLHQRVTRLHMRGARRRPVGPPRCSVDVRGKRTASGVRPSRPAPQGWRGRSAAPVLTAQPHQRGGDGAEITPRSAARINWVWLAGTARTSGPWRDAGERRVSARPTPGRGRDLRSARPVVAAPVAGEHSAPSTMRTSCGSAIMLSAPDAIVRDQ